jgi:hypothetical protein
LFGEGDALALAFSYQVALELGNGTEERLQPGPLSIFAGGFVSEDAVDVEVLDLSVRVLIITADPEISDALTFARRGNRFMSEKV